MPWYYEVDRQQRGPVSDGEFANLVRTGTVRAETLVWQEGWENWRTYATVAGSSQPPPPDNTGDTAICAVSGRRMPKRDMLEFDGRWVSAEHKEQFFQRLREGVTQPTERVYASFGRRFGAKFIDGLIIGGVNMVVGGVIGGIGAAMLIGGGAGLESTSTAILIQVVAQLVGIALTLAYSLFFIRKYDATPGKKMLGMKVLRSDGSSLSKGRIVARYFSEWVSSIILLIGYIMAAFDQEERRALHDRMCDTRVIDVRNT